MRYLFFLIPSLSKDGSAEFTLALEAFVGAQTREYDPRPAQGALLDRAAAPGQFGSLILRQAQDEELIFGVRPSC